jgi:AcrR family transcriptional regulator
VPSAQSTIPSRAPEARQRRKGPETPLTRERIVATALALVDRSGVGALSMRRLGAELGVDPMAVYYHLPSKEALEDAIVEAVMAELDLSMDDPGETPEERIMVAVRAYRDHLAAHGNALPIVLARAPATAVAMRPVELLIGLLRTAGLPPWQALAGMHTIAAAVRGMVGISAGQPGRSREQIAAMVAALPADQFPHLREASLGPGDPWQRDFEFGMRALARGLIGEVPGRPSNPWKN